MLLLATDLSEDKLSMAQVLNKNRTLVMAILGVPVFGMLIAVGVIFYTKPDNMTIAFGVILFIAVQYILMMFFFLKKVETMVKKEKRPLYEEMEDKLETSEEKVVENKGQLEPEEKRIFPVEEGSS